MRYDLNLRISGKDAAKDVSVVNKALEDTGMKAEATGRRVTEATNRVRRARTEAFNFNKEANSSAVALGALGARLAGLFAGYRMAQYLLGYSDQMAVLKAVTQASTQQMVAFNKEALRLGSVTRFGPREVGRAMTIMAKAGLEANEVFAGTEVVLRLATAGMLDIATAAETAAKTLRAFRLPISDLPHVADVLTIAANKSTTDVRELAEGLKYVGPVAAAAGVPLEEVAAVMMGLADAGLAASLGGTTLRRIISDLMAPARNTNEVLNKYNLRIENLRVSTVGLTTAIQRLVAANLAPEDVFKFFDVRAAPGYEAFKGAMSKIEKYTQLLIEARGESKRVSDIMNQNLAGAVQHVIGSFEALVLRMGQLGPGSAGTRAVEGLAGAIRTLTNNVGMLVAAVSILLGVLGFRGLARIIPAIIPGLRQLVEAMVMLRFAGLAAALSFTGITAKIVAFRAAMAMLWHFITIGLAAISGSPIAMLVVELAGLSLWIATHKEETLGFLDKLRAGLVGIGRATDELENRRKGGGGRPETYLQMAPYGREWRTAWYSIPEKQRSQITGLGSSVASAMASTTHAIRRSLENSFRIEMAALERAIGPSAMAAGRRAAQAFWEGYNSAMPHGTAGNIVAPQGIWAGIVNKAPSLPLAFKAALPEEYFSQGVKDELRAIRERTFAMQKLGREREIELKLLEAKKKIDVGTSGLEDEAIRKALRLEMAQADIVKVLQMTREKEEERILTLRAAKVALDATSISEDEYRMLLEQLDPVAKAIGNQERQNLLLRIRDSKEREIQAAVMAVELETGKKLVGARREEYEALLRANQMLKEQDDLRQSILGPIQKQIDQLEALEAISGELTGRQWDKWYETIVPEAGINAGLVDQLELLRLTGLQAEIRSHQMELDKASTNGAGDAHSAFNAYLVEQIYELDQARSVFDEYGGSMADIQDHYNAIVLAAQVFGLTAQQQARATRDLKKEMILLQSEGVVDLRYSLFALGDAVMENSETVADAIEGMYGALEDNLTRMILDSKTNLRAFFDYVRQELARMAVRDMVRPIIAAAEAAVNISSGTGGKPEARVLEESSDWRITKNGTDFIVPGYGGGDSQSSPFAGSPGKGMVGTSSGKTGRKRELHIHVHGAQDLDKWARSEGEVMSRSYAMARRMNERNG